MHGIQVDGINVLALHVLFMDWIYFNFARINTDTFPVLEAAGHRTCCFRLLFRGSSVVRVHGFRSGGSGGHVAL